MSYHWLPFEALEPLVPDVKRAFGQHSKNQRAFYRGRKRGAVTDVAADELAVALGKHPWEIWGDDWSRLDD